MKRLIILFCGLFLTVSTFCQWTKLATPSGEWFNSICFVNQNTGWVAGRDINSGYGIIYKTTNGGQNWISQAPPEIENLEKICFIDQNNGFAVGWWSLSSNTFLKTTNGGDTWQLTDPDLSVKRYYYDVQFVNQYYGWIVGASCKILFTSDGGLNWSTQNVGTTLPYLYAVFFISTTIGWVASSDGRIWKTINSGVTWTLQDTPTASVEKPLYDIYFINSAIGWACGDDGIILYTSDGGDTWLTIASNITGNYAHISEIQFVNATTGFATTGSWNSILKTTDGGSTWAITTADLGFGESIFFIDQNIGYAAGSNGIVKTTTGGELPLPAGAGPISGPTSVCQDQDSVIYSVPTIAYATSYIWILPSGASGTSSTNSIIVNYGISAVSGSINVKGHNASGDGAESSLSIQVNIKPATPSITQNGNQLVSNAPNGNQWYLNNNLIPGATNQTYDSPPYGSYYVIVTLNGCSSNMSNTILATDVEEIDDNRIKVFPNPAKDDLTIETKTYSTVEITNTQGQIVKSIKILNKKATIDISQLSGGVYTIKIITDDEIFEEKLIKQ